MVQRTLSCREFIDFIGNFLDAELPGDELQRFQSHLAVCPDCVNYLDGYQKSAVLQARAFDPEAPVPESVPEELIAAILDVRRRAPRRGGRPGADT